MAEEDTGKKRPTFSNEPRIVTIHKSESGFGFNVRGQVSEGGQLKSINGELYAPLQHVSAVLEGGAADRAGILRGDRILEVNGTSVEGATHKFVVDLIKQGGDSLTLTVISVPNYRDQDGPDNSEDSSGYSNYDYSDKKPLPITIPDYQHMSQGGDKYVVYNIYMSGKLLVSHRYSQFADLHNRLKREFVDFAFPKFPGKWPFTLSEQQLDARRRALEYYLEKVSTVTVIAASETVREFLKTDLRDDREEEQPEEDNNRQVEMRIAVPGKDCTTVSISRSNSTEEVYKILVKQLKMDKDITDYFALFYLTKTKFARKLLTSEFPYNLYVQNQSNSQSKHTCIALRKWVFSPRKELFLNHDEMAMSFLYWQAVEDLNAKRIKAGNHLSDLKKHQDRENKLQYLKIIRDCEGYGEIAFPHCPCDARRAGHVIPIVGFSKFKLQACTEDGTLEAQVPSFDWEEIKSFDIDDEGMALNFEYEKPGKKRRGVKVCTKYFEFLGECFARVLKERELSKQNEQNHNGNSVQEEENDKAEADQESEEEEVEEEEEDEEEEEEDDEEGDL